MVGIGNRKTTCLAVTVNISAFNKQPKIVIHTAVSIKHSQLVISAIRLICKHKIPFSVASIAR